jgi:hypothetical protein
VVAKELLRRLLTVSSAEVCVRDGGTAARDHLQRIAGTVLDGYHLALHDDGLGPLVEHLERFAPEERGYAFEGSAMALTILDLLHLGRGGRLGPFLAGPAAPYVHMAHVGIGWGLARLPIAMQHWFRRFDSFLRWLVVDGYGFHEGFFRPAATIDRQRVPRRLRGYARRAFDQGVGRSLWFVEGTDAATIVRRIEAFPAARRPDLWSGVGLACCYAGGAGREAIAALAATAGGCLPHLAQGAVFAAKARLLGGTEPAHTRMACAVITGRSAPELAELADRIQAELPGAGAVEPAYELWRQRIQETFHRPRETQ